MTARYADENKCAISVSVQSYLRRLEPVVLVAGRTANKDNKTETETETEGELGLQNRMAKKLSTLDNSVSQSADGRIGH